MDELATGLSAIAARYGIHIQTCGTNGDFIRKDLNRKGMRQGCHCIESRDIGAYDTCINGCKYCYADKTPRKAFENSKLHKPDSPFLLGRVKPQDTITQGTQKSFLPNGTKNQNL